MVIAHAHSPFRIVIPYNLFLWLEQYAKRWEQGAPPKSANASWGVTPIKIRGNRTAAPDFLGKLWWKVCYFYGVIIYDKGAV
jgi:hypothetical protein